jgi:hypothetical protein
MEIVKNTKLLNGKKANLKLELPVVLFKSVLSRCMLILSFDTFIIIAIGSIILYM